MPQLTKENLWNSVKNTTATQADLPITTLAAVENCIISDTPNLGQIADPSTNYPNINVAHLKPPVPAQNALDPSPELQLPVETENLPAVLPAAEAVELTTTTMAKQPKGFPGSLLEEDRIVLAQDGKAYSVRGDAGNQYVVAVGTKYFNNIIREKALEQGINLRKNDISDINAMLQGCAERAKVYRDVWLRVATIEGGIMIDLGDDAHTHVRITAGKVEIVTTGSDVLFSRSPVSLSMAMPAETGDLNRLNKYLNVHPAAAVLLV